MVFFYLFMLFKVGGDSYYFYLPIIAQANPEITFSNVGPAIILAKRRTARLRGLNTYETISSIGTNRKAKTIDNFLWEIHDEDLITGKAQSRRLEWLVINSLGNEGRK